MRRGPQIPARWLLHPRNLCPDPRSHFLGTVSPQVLGQPGGRGKTGTTVTPLSPLRSPAPDPLQPLLHPGFTRPEMRWLLGTVEHPTLVRKPPGLQHPAWTQALGDLGQSLTSTPQLWGQGLWAFCPGSG